MGSGAVPPPLGGDHTLPRGHGEKERVSTWLSRGRLWRWPGQRCGQSHRPALWHLFGLELALEAGGNQAVGVEALCGGVQALRLAAGGAGPRPLQAEEGQDGLHLAGVAAVRHGAALGGQPAAGHPAGVLLLLGGQRAVRPGRLRVGVGPCPAPASARPGPPPSHPGSAGRARSCPRGRAPGV